ncbi:MAG: hypothetical protein ACREKE_08465 [bacterium]
MSDNESIFNPEFDSTEFEIDYNAPEPGQFPPSVEPGTYRLMFKLAAKPFNYGPIPQLNGSTHLKVSLAPEAILDDGTIKRIAFQNVSTFKTEKMPNSSVGDLLRSLDLVLDKMNGSSIKNALLGATGNKIFRAVIGWEAYFKDTQTTVSTAPNKKRGDTPWPRNAEGNFESTAVNPSTGEKSYGRERIIRYLLPKD